MSSPEQAPRTTRGRPAKQQNRQHLASWFCVLPGALVCYQVLIVYCQVLIVYYKILIVDYRVLTVYYLVLAVYYLALAVYYLVQTAHAPQT